MTKNEALWHLYCANLSTPGWTAQHALTHAREGLELFEAQVCPVEELGPPSPLDLFAGLTGVERQPAAEPEIIRGGVQCADEDGEPITAEGALSNKTTAVLNADTAVRGAMEVAAGLSDGSGSEPVNLSAPKSDPWLSGEAQDPAEAVKRALDTAKKLRAPEPKRLLHGDKVILPDGRYRGEAVVRDENGEPITTEAQLDAYEERMRKAAAEPPKSKRSRKKATKKGGS